MMSRAQLMKHEAAHSVDTIFIKGDRFLFYGDKAVYIENDTSIVVPDSLDFFVRKNPISKSDAFYDSVETKMSRTAVSKMAYDLLFKDNSGGSKKKVFNDNVSQFRFTPYSGNIINPMEYKKLPVFGSSINDTSYYKANKYVHFLNKSHINTNRVVIRRNLTFRRNEVLDPLELIDSERLLRSRKYIKDARIVVDSTSSSDSVAVHVVTKDIFPYSASYRPSNNNGALFGISTYNFLGVGHEVEINAVKHGGAEYFYSIKNIGGSFTDIYLNYSRHRSKRGQGLIVDKQFLTIDTRVAGGLEWSNYDYNYAEYPLDSDEADGTLFHYSLHTRDIWIGRSFDTRVNLKKYGFSGDNQFVLSARVNLQDYYDKPLVTVDSNYVYQDRNDYLIQAGFSSRVYYQDSYVVNFGRTEDIPTGTTIGFTAGFQEREFENRYYLGAQFSKGGYINGFGYLNTIYALGGFIDNGLEDVIFTASAEYFSGLKRLGRLRFRQFVNSTFSYVFVPSSDYQLWGQGDLGVRGVSSYYLKATSHFSINLESLFFTSKYILGFRVAFFGFLDGAFASNSYNPEFGTDTYSGFGAGLRFRNDNLAFPTMNIRLGYYPSTPYKANTSYADFSTSADLRIREFRFGAPEIVEFK